MVVLCPPIERAAGRLKWGPYNTVWDTGSVLETCQHTRQRRERCSVSSNLTPEKQAFVWEPRVPLSGRNDSTRSHDVT